MDRFVNSILPHVPSCPRTLIKSEVLAAAIAFCVESYIYQVDSEEEVLAGEDTITLTVPDNTDLVDVQVSIDKAGYTSYSRADNEITLDTPAGSDTTYRVTQFLAPAADATSLPDLLFVRWKEALVTKARAELMLMPEKKWFNPNLAQVNQAKYLHELGNAKMEARKPIGQARMRVKMRGW